MEYKATTKYIRTSTRKLRVVADAIRKLTPQEAAVQLASMPKQAATPLGATLASAIANARQKNADVSKLKFKTIEIMGGPMMKRWRAVSRGVAHGYKKRMTHIRIVLTDGSEAKE